MDVASSMEVVVAVSPGVEAPPAGYRLYGSDDITGVKVHKLGAVGSYVDGILRSLRDSMGVCIDCTGGFFEIRRDIYRSRSVPEEWRRTKKSVDTQA